MPAPKFSTKGTVPIVGADADNDANDYDVVVV